MMLKGWEAHLPPGVTAEGLDLTAKGSLPAAWSGVWASAPSAQVLRDAQRGLITAAELEDATRRVAGRLQAAGLGPGDRMLFSAESSLELVVAHVAALRSGMVVVPTNTAYREREVAHIVSDARVRRGRWSTQTTAPAGCAPPRDQTRSWSGPRWTYRTASRRYSMLLRPRILR